MNIRRIAALAAAAAVVPWLAWAADVFDFIPSGGRTLLAQVFAAKPAAADVRAVLTGKHSRDEWLRYLQEHEKALGGVQKLDDKQRLTLADYLSFNMPLASPPADVARVAWDKALPLDGRDMALERCQGCHIITVVVTQKRSKDAWLGTMGKPSHVQIKLKKEQREALASYLVINAGIPIDDVPEELRAGGATY
jgi:mono/diheme cytochrome c family protein